MPENTNNTVPLLKAKVRCVCTKQLKPGELPAENEVDEERKNGTDDPTGEALKAVISKNAATR